MINLDYVQKFIEKEISPDFEVHQYFDIKDFVVFLWKYKQYDKDDERGRIIGYGPVIYDKAQDEYRVMGSGERLSEDIRKIFESEESKERRRDHDYLMGLFENQEDTIHSAALIEKIKANIRRRKYVNSEDIDFLSILTGARRIDREFDMIFKPEWKDRKHIVVVSNLQPAKEKLIQIWREIGFEYKELAENELLLFQIKG